MLRISMGLFLLSALGFAAAAEDSATVLARAKTASGAARWDGIRSWHGDGTITSGQNVTVSTFNKTAANQ